MWIFCCGMQRSGSTLQFQITARLVEAAGLGKRVEWTKPARFGKRQKQHAADPGWKVFKSHVCTPAMMEEFHRQNAMGVYCYRDLRDMLVSSMRMHNLSFEPIWESGIIESSLRQYAKWTSLPRVLVSKYEEMMAALPGEVARIAAHLGIAVDAAKCAQIAAEHTLERQKARIEDSQKTGRLKRGAANALFDPQTNLHANHIYSGASGSWKEVLSKAQAGKIEDQAGDWLLAHGYALAG